MYPHPTNLNGEICVVTSYFNPLKHKNKLDNFHLFKNGLDKVGAKLAVIECTFSDTTPDLDESCCDHYHKISGGDVMWQKERLLNIMVRRLPATIDKIIFCDADILFTSPTWLKRAAEQLSRYRVIQPYSYFIRLPKGQVQGDQHTSQIGTSENEKYFSFALGFNTFKSEPLDFRYAGASGFAWGLRRSVLEACPLFDKMIVGGGDLALADGCVSGVGRPKWKDQASLALVRSFENWRAKMFAVVEGSVGVVDETIFHLWHGDIKNRAYSERMNILKEAEFDPEADIKCEENSPWYWSTSKQRLHDEIGSYFHSRKEDDSF